LGLYFLFTFIRLALSYRSSLSNWFLTLSVIVDIGLLMVLIWSFHIQYMQPASFYLKSPTMIYVFIFISLRTLRFDPRYILLAGATAAIGWLILVFYVIWSERGQSMITRDYVTYLTSNSILIGAEIDKIIAIVLVSTVLAIAVLRAQRSFTRAVTDEIAASELSRFISPEVAARITHANQQIKPGDGEAARATIMFTDIEGFSGVSEKLSPQELAAMLNEYFAATSNVKADPDHALNAVRTAIDITRVCTETTFCHGGRLKTRCGINTGDIVIGAVGSENRLTFTVHGDNVNIAARLEQLNKQYGSYILATEDTVRACEEGFAWQARGEVTVRGRETPTPIFSL
jgi:adenylate cyclase